MTHRPLPFFRHRLVTNLLVGAAVLVASIGSQPAAAATQATGGAASYETPAGVGADGSQIFDRSHSAADSSSVGATSQPKSVTNSSPNLLASFDGMNHFSERFGSASGRNQYSLEPPDQGLCVGQDANANVRVVEALNDVFDVYDTSGTPLLPKPTALNAFFNYAPSIIRGAGPGGSPLFGPFVTDPSCLYDASTGRWFVDVLTLDVYPTVGDDGNSHYTGTNHLDIAVSTTSDPTGAWNLFSIPVQDDGSAGTPNHHCSAGTETSKPLPTNPTACFGDYPHIGSNADDIFLTTNEYSFFGNEFHGAQIYAINKTALVGGSLVFQQFDTSGNRATDPNGFGDPFGFGINGFTLWPSVTPTATGYGAGDGHTEYFLSSNAAAEAHDTGDGTSTAHPSTQLLIWSLNGTDGTATLSVSKQTVGEYLPPPLSEQKSGNQPLRDCLNNNHCSLALEGIKDPFSEQSNGIDSNDTRMQQVTWVNGSLWGALDTGLNTSNGKQAGIEWFKVAVSGGSAGVSGATSGYVSLGNDNLNYPAIGITASGNGVMAFTVVGTDYYPSAGYALISPDGVGDVHIAAAGQGPDDGFTGYKLFGNPPGTTRPRWGDYGAAIPWGNNVWLASEYIGQSCGFSTFERTGFVCGGTRSALANWGTRISEVSAP